MNADAAYKKFFAGKAGHPRFKKKGRRDPGAYFPNGDYSHKHSIIEIERHRIKIPTMGWIRVKEKGYLPYYLGARQIRSVTVNLRAGRYYASVLAEVPEPKARPLSETGLGVDFGIKELAVASDGRVFGNINKSRKLRKLEKKLKREQRSLSRKYGSLKKRSKLKKKGKATRQNIQKQLSKIRRLYARIEAARRDHLNKCVAELVRTKPAYVVIEDLNVGSMLKNRHLAGAVAAQALREFREKLVRKARLAGVEVRMVSRWYPSSKTCHACSFVKRDLKLKDRVYKCPACGFTIDRDLNAALNLRDASDYEIVA